MATKLSSHGFPICPEVCQFCRNGTHVMHIIDELGDIHLTLLPQYNRDKENKVYEIHGFAECSPDNFWLKRIFEYTNKVLQETE